MVTDEVDIEAVAFDVGDVDLAEIVRQDRPA